MKDIWLQGDGGLISMEEALGDNEPMPEENPCTCGDPTGENCRCLVSE